MLVVVIVVIIDRIVRTGADCKSAEQKKKVSGGERAERGKHDIYLRIFFE